MDGIQNFMVVVVFLYLGIFSEVKFAVCKSSGFSLRLIPMDSPESPLYSSNLSRLQRIERLINFSMVKAGLMKLHSIPNATFDDEKFLIPMERQAYYQVGEINIGTPPQSVYLVVDTGSSLLWTQCQPCINCFPQESSIYDSRSSSSYQSIPCEHPHCRYRDPRSHFQCIDGDCAYTFYFGNNAIGPTKGVLSAELFTFQDSDGDTSEFNVLFGCSNDNTNFGNFNFPHNKISGIMGLNLSPESLFTQLFDLIGGTFSYCIARIDQYYTHPHIMRFGDDVDIPPGIATTHYYSFEGLHFYYLNCIDISIGAYRLGLPAGTFDATVGTGFIIDSGTPFTTLTTQAMTGINVYQMVISALMQYYNFFNFVRVPARQNPTRFELCYWNQEGFTNFPSLTYHLQGADYTIDGRYLNMNLGRGRFFCITLLGSPGMTMLGANHMQDMRIIHNGNMEAIQFYPVDDCDHDHL